MSECLFSGDKTGWKVFETMAGKVGYRWSLWVFRSASVIDYRMDPGRSAQVPKEHFANPGEQLNTDLNNMVPELGPQPTELVMLLENRTFRR